MSSALKPTRDGLLNEVVARLPVLDLRMKLYARLGMNLDPASCTIMMHTEVRRPQEISIDRGTVIGRHCLLDGRGGLTIGRGVNVSSRAMLITGTHRLECADFASRFAPIVIEDHAWVASNATVLGGVTIGHGAVVAAGAVVVRDARPMTIYGGVPARPIGKREVLPAYELHHRVNWA